MSKFLVVFEEAGGPETCLVNTLEEAYNHLNGIMDDCMESPGAIAESSKIYEVISCYNVEVGQAFKVSLEKEYK